MNIENLKFIEHNLEFKNEYYTITIDPFLVRGCLTVNINYKNQCFWISFNIHPLESKYFSYKQLSFNYNNYIFTRNAEKKNKDDKEILWSRNIDRSIRPYIPNNFPFNINIECWNLTVSDIDPTIPLIIGCVAGLLSLGIINKSIMPVVCTEKFYMINAMIYDNKIANLEIGAKELSIDHIIELLSNDLHNYPHYNQLLTQLFNPNNYDKLLNNYEPYEVYSIKHLLKSINNFHESMDNNEKYLSHITEDLINDIIDNDLYNIFLHGNFDKNIDGWIFNQLKQKNFTHNNLFTEQIFYQVRKVLFCNNLLTNKCRHDHRKFLDSRPIMVDITSLNNFHNSIALIKGKTRALVGGYFIPQDKSYDNQVHIKYIFNSFINAKKNSNRREIGHGHLIEKSINNIMGNNKWKVFINSYIPNSDGSSSMLSVIGAGLLLNHFQLNLEKISGISIGMIETKKKNYYLVDIAENEDFYCSMDMKITSTKNGIVSVQLDVKNQGISLKILEEVLHLGYKKNNKIIKDIYKSSMNKITSNYYDNQSKDPITCKNYFNFKN